MQAAVRSLTWEHIMTNNLWTPGPWRVVNKARALGGAIHVDAQTGTVCRIEKWTQAVDLADAHLIAAAPAMYEALQDCHSALGVMVRWAREVCD